MGAGMTRDLLQVMLYVDPGSGFLVLQMLLAGVLGAVFYFRRAVQNCIRRLGSGRKKDKTS